MRRIIDLYKQDNFDTGNPKAPWPRLVRLNAHA